MVKEHPVLFAEFESKSISAEVCAKLLYSASVLDLATTCCLQDHHEMRFGHKKTAAPEVDRLSSNSDAQSASQRALIGKG